MMQGMIEKEKWSMKINKLRKNIIEVEVDILRFI